MRLLISALVLLASSLTAQDFILIGAAPGWNNVLRSLGLVPSTSLTPRVVVAADIKSNPSIETYLAAGSLIVIEGHSPLAESLGITSSNKQLEVRQIRDSASPELPIVWNTSATISAAKLGEGWQLRGRDRWTGEPVLAVRRQGAGSILWTATSIGESGYDRYPFLPQALLAAGLEPRVKGQNLWAFFDAGFRQRVDLSYLVTQWKRAGLGAIHITSWQFDSAEPDRAKWLEQLISLCHENLIQVYAWVELPHVSEQFWQNHPECRERTATGMEASLDWRRLMNLVEPRCAQLAEDNILTLLRRYDWDGVNLGELYFESLEGHGNPARFTPFNDAVRAEYKQLHGRDALEDLKGDGLPALLEYRANLAARLQSDWLARLEVLRRDKPDFDIILTHIDDRFDTRMRDALGADAARVLRGTEGLGTGFLIEDPATVWHLGPARYREIRKRYEGLTKEPERLSIDLNIVDRYQDVYPTRRQTGAELAQLIHEASANFDQVALYFEYSLRPVDQPLLAPAAARVESFVESDAALSLKLGAPGTVAWKGAAKVNGAPWPLTDGNRLFLPAGEWRIERSSESLQIRLIDLNVRIEKVSYDGSNYLISYKSRTRGTALIESPNGVERRLLRRGSGVISLSGKQPAAAVESSSAPLLHQR